jgi:hypothetical protein
MPGAYRDGEDEHGSGSSPTFTLGVDGELFAVHVVEGPDTNYSDTGYTWLSGPNEGYGFGIGGPSKPTLEDHRERIREFLAEVDPSTGYLEED